MSNIKTFNSLVFGAFMISGLAALIYQSVWSKYLGLLLGHAAYAQSLVLMIFMGGMALGAWIAGRFSQRLSNVLLLYVIVEAVIGVMALLFHTEYVSAVGMLFEKIVPSIDSLFAINFLKWLLASILILPQSILLGMTFPLLSGGLIQLNKGDMGRNLSLLYFANSMGAGLGALIAVFYLLPLYGLPGATKIAGILSILVAVVMLVYLKKSTIKIPKIKPSASSDQFKSKTYFIFLAAAITGAASFAYEIVWIRVLSLVLGSSIHVFEIMLSAFILGLAFGGLAIRKKIDVIDDTGSLIAWAQILMGLSALLSIPLFVSSFGWVGFLVESLASSSSGYTLFNFASAIISMCIMLPATFFAGMTLPLMTVYLLKRNKNNSAIGFVYASNTLGGIVGVLLAMHVGLPVLGIKVTLITAAAIDILLGLVFLIFVSRSTKRKEIYFAGLFVFSLVSVVAYYVRVDPLVMSSGVYRLGHSITSNGKNLFYQDGKTATIALTEYEDKSIVISTNGKPDARVMMDAEGKPSIDEITMIALGAFPYMLAENAEHIANIGFGSGQTSHTLLLNKRVKSLDNVEIEEAIVKAARGYNPMNAKAYDDHRSSIHIDDAKTYFSGRKKKYDIIVSEPSNPWVSGVAGLFTSEFYGFLKDHMTDDGILVQWVQLYEISTPLVASIFKAIDQEMSDYLVFNANSANILIFAKKKGMFDSSNDNYSNIFKNNEIRMELERVNVESLMDVFARFLGNKYLLQPYFNSFTFPPNSDYHPILMLYAPQARFMRDSAAGLLEHAAAELPVIEMLTKADMPPGFFSNTNDISNGDFPRSININLAKSIYSAIASNSASEVLSESGSEKLLAHSIVFKVCPSVTAEENWSKQIHQVAIRTISYLEKDENIKLWGMGRWSACHFRTNRTKLQLQLYESLALRDPVGIYTYSTALLKEKTQADANQEAFYVDAALLGYIAADAPECALEIEESFGNANYSQKNKQIHRRLLKSLAETNSVKKPKECALW